MSRWKHRVQQMAFACPLALLVGIAITLPFCVASALTPVRGGMTMGPVHIPFIFLAASFVGLVILVPLGYIRGKRRDLLAIHEAMPLPSKATDGFYADDISANPPSKVLGVLAQTALALPLALFLGAAVAMPFWVVYEVVPVWAGIDLRRVPTLVFWVASFASFLIILSLAYARGKRIEAGKQQPSQRDQELKSV